MVLHAQNKLLKQTEHFIFYLVRRKKTGKQVWLICSQSLETAGIWKLELEKQSVIPCFAEEKKRKGKCKMRNKPSPVLHR